MTQQWRKSSYSTPNGSCVELVGTLDGLRDSKNPGTVLTIDLAALLTAVKTDRFTR